MRMSMLPGGVRMGDANKPGFAIVPQWGPDGYSRRTAFFNAIRANPFSPASWGIGVRPAPGGASFTENTKSDAYLDPQQFFRGFTTAIRNPALKTTQQSASFPSANVQVNPVLMAFNNQRGQNWGTPT